MADLVFSIRNIFNASDGDGCLAQYNAKGYLIPSYQRGYKWASDNQGAVSILLKDLDKAFREGKKEYYLQYITVKENHSVDDVYLELIDGQQRLTTLSILIAVFSLKLNEEDFANLINYEIRGGFFQNTIHNRNNLMDFIDNKWPRNDDENKQDIYYIHSAAKAITDFVKDLSKLKNFYSFILDNVKLIVNVIERDDSERVFANLNSNKVDLKDSELIKGYLITNIGRENDRMLSFSELTESRVKLGIQWDEMERWCNDHQVSSFYFGSRDGLSELLLLSESIITNLDCSKIKQKGERYYLFNKFLDNVSTTKTYCVIMRLYHILKDLYKTTEIYNLLGYIMFAKGSENQDIIKLFNLSINNRVVIREYFYGNISKNKLKEDLLSHIKQMIDGKDIRMLSYGEDEDKMQIHRILLAINVFDIKNNCTSEERFNFYEYIRNGWTLEHIFPQTPAGKGNTFSPDEVKLISDMVDVEEERKKLLYLLNKQTMDESDKKNISQILSPVVNQLGNMCLLTSSDNASNGCNMFDVKRSNILKRIRKGSFVPKHTFEVFSKVIFESNPGDLQMWTIQNIEEHRNIIIKGINLIRSFKYE